MQVKTQTLTFAGGGAQVIAISGFAHAARLFVEPDNANTHVCYVGDTSFVMGTSTVNGVIKQLQIPDSNKIIKMDNFDLDITEGRDLIDLGQFKFDGTSGEKVRVTIFVG